ncbi:MAG: toll/interleukin-1 receptor domain-containing protein [Ilumatobacteraceae bacterium]
MKLFISYRRDDTAGRAGRLFDVLVARFGARNVFQDVAAIAPGTDFTKRVEDAIAQSDAALVVIGSEWLTLSGPDGTRRLDAPDDYVRREVSSALAAGLRVVPVLVGDAELPAEKDLPTDLRALVNRQAARIDDDSWHQDVDALIRRLEGEEVIDRPRRRWPLVSGVVAAVVATVLIGWAWIGRDGGGDGDDGGSESSDEPTGCPMPDDTWPQVDVAEGATGTDQLDRRSIEYVVHDAAYRVEQSGEFLIVLGIELANHNEPVAGTGDDDEYFSPAAFDDVLVDRVATGKPYCFTPLTNDRNVEPGERALGLVGFLSLIDPNDVQLVLEASGGVDIEISE